MSNFQTLTVYLGSSGRCRPVFKDAAKELGQAIGTSDKSLVYGGMDAGLMGIVANETLQAGGHVTGIIPKSLKDSERIHPKLNETILVPDLWERKLKMFKRADAIIGLPGGFGTIDEVLEVLYWGSLGSHDIPTVLINIEGYWDDFVAYVRSLPDFAPEYLHIVDRVEDLFTYMDGIKAPSSDNHKDFPHFEAEILNDGSPILFEEANLKESYVLATALGLKQLDKHHRNIGLLNKNNQFSPLLRWMETAQKEHFITDRCLELFSTADDIDALKKKLTQQAEIHIDLHNEKWGPSETDTHIEIHEKE